MEGLVKPSEDLWLRPIFDIQGVIFYYIGYDIGERSIFEPSQIFYIFTRLIGFVNNISNLGRFSREALLFNKGGRVACLVE